MRLCSTLLLLSVVIVSVAAAPVSGMKHFLQPPSAVSLLQEESFMDRSGTQMRLEAGSHVRMKGLTSAADLNGRQGTIQAYDPYSGRYVITMTSGGPSKRIRPENVELLELSEINDDPVADGERFHHGTHVTLFGLHQLRALNGKVGVVRHFDFATGRYVVEIPGQPPKRIKPSNLRRADGVARGSLLSNRQMTAPSGPPGGSSLCQSVGDDAGPSGFSKGTKVRLHGLRSALARPWNGLIAVVHCFDASSQRYVVALPDGTPRKIKAGNLQAAVLGPTDGGVPALSEQGGQDPSSGSGPGPDSSRSDSGSQQGKTSICKEQMEQQASSGFKGPGGFAISSKVILHGLKSPSALSGHWNGMTGVVHCFDSSTQRYVVACSDGAPRKLRAANLMSASGGGGGAKSNAGSICQQQASKRFVGPGGLAVGSKVQLHGLRSAAAVKGGWNGMVGVIHCFVNAEQRFVVSCPDGIPRKLKLANLQRLHQEVEGTVAYDKSQPDSEGAPQAGHAKSVCEPQLSRGQMSVGPGALAIGTKVALFGLTSKAAVNGRWNGMVGVVHCFDSKSLRYVVAMSDGHPRKLKVENLAIVTTAVTQPTQNQTTGKTTPPKKVNWMKGAYVRLFGLKSASELNGQVASVVAFENATQRYLVKVPGLARLKRIRVANLADVASTESAAPAVVPAVANVVGAPPAPVAQHGSGHQLSVCNAYATHAPIQVFAVSADGKRYTHVVKSLDFQSCADLDDLPSDQVASLRFIIGKFQVAKKVVDFSSLTPGQGLELVVFRKDQNSLQALVHENPVEIGDSEAYYLHIVNAYAGRKSLELHVQRGKFLKQLPLDKTFRLSTMKAINLVLSDGSQKLRLAFQPRRAKTYCIMTTGVDEGLRGEPRNVGLVAHEIGTWTSSEEMINADANEQGASTAPGQLGGVAGQSTDAEVEGDNSPTARPTLGLASVLGNLFSGTSSGATAS